jgi:acyl carrier protein
MVGVHWTGWPQSKRDRTDITRNEQLNIEQEVKNILAEVLSLGHRADRWDAATPLLGSLPELDSMAVVTVITTVEERFGFSIDDDEISAQVFATLGSLTEFINGKLAA